MMPLVKNNNIFGIQITASPVFENYSAPVDIDKSNANMNKVNATIIYLANRWQIYAII